MEHPKNNRELLSKAIREGMENALKLEDMMEGDEDGDQDSGKFGKTKKGCACAKNWHYQGVSASGCANPDNNVGGNWCMVMDESCEDATWGFCDEDKDVTSLITVRIDPDDDAATSSIPDHKDDRFVPADQVYPVLMHSTFFPDVRNHATCNKSEIFTQWGYVPDHGEMSTVVGIDIVDKPHIGGYLTRIYKQLLEVHEDRNHLKIQLERSIKKVFGFKPAVRKIGIAITNMPSWNIAACAIHMKYLVKRFSNAYTVNRVPYALYNTCTLFSTKETFSHDLVVSPEEDLSARCHEATIKFSQQWDFGSGSMKFKGWCQDVCHIKYGSGALQCNPDLIPLSEGGGAPAPARMVNQ